ncbi:MAG: CAP domain-containing protein, partial [Chloroflexota bacterium]
TTPAAMVPACDGVHIRSGSTTASPVKLTLAANATLTVAGTVSGGTWRTTCPGAKTGSHWYRVTAIGGRSVKAAYGVTSLYAATGVLTAAPTPPASSTDAFASDLMRLINLDRKALGKAPYMIDGRLAQIARDARFTCPTNHAKAFNGRARDMADRGYFGHIVPGCYSSGTTPFRSVQIVRRVFGYAGARSEILHWNSYGSTATTTYRLGCDITGKNCKAATTTAPFTVTLAQRNFMSSAPHRAAELNSYQRFGCGTATVPGTKKTYFACLFADGGSSIPLPPPPTPAPPAAITMVPACAAVNLRTGTSTSRAIRVRLRSSARVTVAATVTGSHWATACPGAKSGTRWYRISTINGRSVTTLYGVRWLYAATGVLKRPS